MKHAVPLSCTISIVSEVVTLKPKMTELRNDRTVNAVACFKMDYKKKVFSGF